MRRLIVAFGIAVALGAPVSAHAEPNVDASFVDALTKAGIGFNDPHNAVDAAKTACGLLDQGKSQLEVVQLVVQQNSAINTDKAAKFTAIAASAYCPRYLQRVNPGQSQPGPGGVGASGGAQH